MLFATHQIHLITYQWALIHSMKNTTVLVFYTLMAQQMVRDIADSLIINVRCTLWEMIRFHLFFSFFEAKHK